MKLPSFAKINLCLQILGKRADGYHEIETLLQTISLHDEIEFKERNDDEVRLYCETPGIPTDMTNLILRAAFGLKKVMSEVHGADIYLTKRIPAKGGLGGASSNAAVALIGLNSLWRLSLKVEQLRQIGAGIGSDVPFFFVGGLARGTGRGTELVPLADRQKKYLVVITPNVEISTAIAYGAFREPSLTSPGSTSILSSSFAGPDYENSDQWVLHNDFEGVIFEMEPEIKRARQALLDAGALGSLMTGSGSSVFGIFDDRQQREQALAILRSENGWRVFSCETTSRAEYSQSLSSSGGSRSYAL